MKNFRFSTLAALCLAFVPSWTVQAAAVDAAECKNLLGEGPESVTLTVRWGDAVALDNLTSLVRFDGEKTAAEIIATALKDDTRFYALKSSEDVFVAYGFDTNGDNSAAVSISGTSLDLTDGVATATDAYDGAKGSSDYDHWKVNSDTEVWKIFINGAEAEATATVTAGDALTLEYTSVEAAEPTDASYTFYLRPATQQGVWLLPELVVNTANGKRLDTPMIANWLDDGSKLYGAAVSTEIYKTDGTTTDNSSYSTYIPNAKKGAMVCQITVRNPSEVLIRPFLNIRKDWGDGKQSVKRIYGDYDSKVSTVVANPLTGIGLEGYEPGATIELKNMGTQVIKPQYYPENADFTGFSFQSSDNSVVSFYSSVNTLVAHKKGEANITITSLDGAVSESYVVKVEGVNPDDRPADFADGMIWLNEEWFTHTSGSLNFIDPDGNIYYRAYGNQNDNKAFGATSQFGMEYADKIFIMSKQAWDGGDTRDRGEEPDRSGGRVVVIDAKTMKRLASFDEIGGDGRAAVGIEPGKVYLSHSKGVRVLTWDENDRFTLADADLPMIAASASAHAGIGDMVKAGKYVFAAETDKAFHVFDTETDSEIFLIKASKTNGKAQGVVRTKDGRVWLGCDMTLLPLDPETFDPSQYESNTVEFADFLPEEHINLPLGKITSCSSSWRHVNLMTSPLTNVLMWGNGNWNGSGGNLYRWDFDEGGIETARTIYEVNSADGFGTGYGSPGYDPLTDTYMFSSMPGFGAAALDNWYHFIDATTGELKHRVQLEKYWWFPAMPIILDKYEPVIEDLPEISLLSTDSEQTYDVNVSDPDNHDCAIRLYLVDAPAVADASSDPAATVRLEGRKLIVTPQAAGTQTFTLAAESNGRVTTKAVNVRVRTMTGIDEVESVEDGTPVYYNLNGIRIAEPTPGQIVIRRLNGKSEKIVM